MRCAVCARQAKGLGYFNPRLRRSDPRRYNDRWVFCSMPCQNAFSRLMERLTQFQEDAVIDPSDMELAAMQSALGPLADYGKDEVLRLVEVVVDAYQAHMLAEHERMVERDRTFFEQLASRKATASTGGDHHRIPF